MTKIPMYPDFVDSGRLVMKSIVTPSLGWSGGGSGILAPYRVWRSALIWWHTLQPATYFRTVVSSPSQ